MQSDLLMHLPFDDGSDPTLDVTGNGHDGVLSGTVEFTQTVPLTVTGGSALWFSGLGGEAVQVDGLALDTSSVTIAFWAKRVGAEEENYIFSQGSGAWAEFLYMKIVDFDSIPEAFLDCSIGTDVVPSREIANDEEWHHYACTFDYDEGGNLVTVTLYEDGVQLGASTIIPDVYTGSGTASIGDTYNGGLDEFLIYKRALSTAEIARLATHELDDNFATVTLLVGTELPQLNVAAAGGGNGSISSDPAGVDCGLTCSAEFGLGAAVTLTAVADTGSTFMGWSGACTGLGDCTLTMHANRNVTATFSLDQHDLDLAIDGTGSGEVSITPPGTTCDSDCSQTFDYNTEVALTAVADNGSTFAGWNGACAGTGDCVLTMDSAQWVTATFTLNQYALDVVLTGNGEGFVISNPAGINCENDCSEFYDHGTTVFLAPVSGPSSHFTGWSGACSGTAICVVSMEAARAVTANFELNDFDLDVRFAGMGSGSITSLPSGIDCQNDYSAAFAHGTVVTLTAVPDAGTTFTGWSGACSGIGNCVVTVNGAKEVTATFALNQYELEVTLAGDGGGTVTSSLPGIDCGTDCTEMFDFGTVVMLTAVPDGNSHFDGWDGACSGLSLVCTLTITEATAVSATFMNNIVNEEYTIFIPAIIRP